MAIDIGSTDEKWLTLLGFVWVCVQVCRGTKKASKLSWVIVPGQNWWQIPEDGRTGVFKGIEVGQNIVFGNLQVVKCFCIRKVRTGGVKPRASWFVLRTRNCNLHTGGANGDLEVMQQHDQNDILEKYMWWPCTSNFKRGRKKRVWEAGWEKQTFWRRRSVETTLKHDRENGPTLVGSWGTRTWKQIRHEERETQWQLRFWTQWLGEGQNKRQKKEETFQLKTSDGLLWRIDFQGSSAGCPDMWVKDYYWLQFSSTAPCSLTS